MLNGFVSLIGATFVVVVGELVNEYDSSIELPLPIMRFCQNSAKTIAISPPIMRSVRAKQTAQLYKRDARFLVCIKITAGVSIFGQTGLDSERGEVSPGLRLPVLVCMFKLVSS